MFKNLAREFKEFAVRGNVVDLAVGIIIGGAFGKIVSSLVADIITPPLGLVIGGVDFSDLALVIKQASAPGATDGISLMYGKFIQAVFDFTIVAFAVFLLVKGINALKRSKAAEVPPAISGEEKLLAEIRDLLKQGR